MNKEQLKRLNEDPRFISGIHNYCDRWCERCAFTSRCLNFALCEEEHANPETRDLNNEKFWNKLNDNFKVIIEMIYTLAKERGIELDETELKEIKKAQCKKDEDVRNNVLARAGIQYINMAQSWFDSAEKLFQQKEDELNLHASCGIPGHLTEALNIEDSTEIIHWYQHMIYAKICRALHGDDLDFEGAEEFPRDSDGSAKVTLIGIDRSIVAWGRLMDQFPDREKSILDICVHLEKLRKNVELTFPNARKFVGFSPDLNK